MCFSIYGASGSFYKCNRYEKIKQAKEKKGLRTASTSAREDLDLFSHCLDGFQGAMDLVQETPDLVASAVVCADGYVKQGTTCIGCPPQHAYIDCKHMRN